MNTTTTAWICRKLWSLITLNNSDHSATTQRDLVVWRSIPPPIYLGELYFQVTQRQVFDYSVITSSCCNPQLIFSDHNGICGEVCVLWKGKGGFCCCTYWVGTFTKSVFGVFVWWKFCFLSHTWVDQNPMPLFTLQVLTRKSCIRGISDVGFNPPRIPSCFDHIYSIHLPLFYL